MSLDYCIKMARKTPHTRGQARHYAVITDKRGRIIAEGANSFSKTHTVMSRASAKLGMCKEYVHAEVRALLRAKGKGVKLIVARVDSRGYPAYSEPCLVCKHLLQNEFKHIKSIEFSM